MERPGSPGPLRGNQPCPYLDLGPDLASQFLDPHNYEATHFCYLRHSASGTLLRQPQNKMQTQFQYLPFRLLWVRIMAAGGPRKAQGGVSSFTPQAQSRWHCPVPSKRSCPSPKRGSGEWGGALAPLPGSSSACPRGSLDPQLSRLCPRLGH